MESPVEITSEFQLCPCFLSEEGRQELLLVACLLGQVLCLVADRAPDGKWIILGTSSRITFGEETVLSGVKGQGVGIQAYLSPHLQKDQATLEESIYTRICVHALFWFCLYVYILSEREQNSLNTREKSKRVEEKQKAGFSGGWRDSEDCQVEEKRQGLLRVGMCNEVFALFCYVVCNASLPHDPQTSSNVSSA